MNKEAQILDLESIHFSEKSKLHDGQKQILKEIIEWESPPPLIKTGRSTFLIIDDENVPFNCIKIKGCGYFDLQKKSSTQPSTKEGYDAYIQNAPDGIKEIHYQIEVDENDELRYAIPPKRPYGAQLYTKAKQEYEVNEKLLNSWEGEKEDFPFYYPVGYAKYKDMIYKDEPLGVTILGLPMQSETPLGAFFEGAFEEKGLRINPFLLNYWKYHTSALGKNQPDYFDLLTTLKTLCYKFGQNLSHLHEHYVDFDSHFFNASVNLQNGNVLLFDFDHVFDAGEISDQKYFYYMLKDFEIGLVAVLSNFMLSGLTDGIVLFEEMNQPIDDYNLIEGYYKGYFGELNEKAKENAKNMWERILLFLGNKVLRSPKKQHLHLVYAFCEQERAKSYYDIFPYLMNKMRNKRDNFILTDEKHKKIINQFIERRKELEKLHQM